MRRCGSSIVGGEVGKFRGEYAHGGRFDYFQCVVCRIG